MAINAPVIDPDRDSEFMRRERIHSLLDADLLGPEGRDRAEDFVADLSCILLRLDGFPECRALLH